MQDITALDVTLAQLNAVQNVADNQFYLTTTELCQLLDIEPVLVDPTGAVVVPRFLWRNFLCVWVGKQDKLDFWVITNVRKQRLLDGQSAVLPSSSSQADSPQPLVVEDYQRIPTKYVHLDQFLRPEEVRKLIKFVRDSQSKFIPTSVSTQDTSYRQSMYLPAFPEFSQLMIERIHKIMPDIMNKIGIPPFTVGDIEAQLTMHNDGNYYKIHNDNGSPETANRVFTYVYYFCHQPQAFSGGSLRLYDSKVENNFYVAADTYTDIEPRHNSIVFFPSYCLHEVLPVVCPSRAFMDSRFTINGWIRQMR